MDHELLANDGLAIDESLDEVCDRSTAVLAIDVLPLVLAIDGMLLPVFTIPVSSSLSRSSFTSDSFSN